MSEIELKFGVPAESLSAVERALRRQGARLRAITSHYWDTAEGRLAAAGLSLRLRRSAGRWEQTVKAAGASPVERIEETVARPGRWGAGGPPPELWMHAGTIAGGLVDAALTRRHGHRQALVRVHSSVIGRLATRIEVGGADIEIALDRGTLAAGDRSLPVCELEAELKEGDVAALFDVARASIDAHGMWLSTIAKSTRGHRLAEGAAAPRATKAGRPRLRGSARGEEIFRAVMRSCLDQVLANASVLAEGEVDGEVVHQLRIGLRRMRTAWRELDEWHGALSAEWEAPTTAVFRALGDYRDRQTVAAALEQPLAAAGSPEAVLCQPAPSAIDDLVALVRSAPFQHALVDVLAFVSRATPAVPFGQAPESTASGGSAPEQTIAARLDKLHARLKRDARRFEQLDERGRHGVRRRLKRLRYLSELVAPLYPERRVRRFLGELEPAQDALGRCMDLIVADRLAREVIAAGDGRAWFNVGWLAAQTPHAIRRCGKALGRVAAATPYWRGVGAR